ncbi:hypothetical protein M406DRAFT_341037 [Cryphonectria parasitica EP155]|uniref:Fungal-type protein kinase domain-containing protein n=1 Tax=Cryphonectria parasitica (strain ATCC 38755 / EP155) TaxID=660469 RepID=A0A9P4XZ94_CRYP1|nr:uncharacterized protein M406DRAFT_341037 [Cryphonectria parasitica EP155]KAF3763512.1 hypothetical protein M406DRAFT_341037 [Cryphonectria parasitica EP155]
MKSSSVKIQQGTISNDEFHAAITALAPAAPKTPPRSIPTPVSSTPVVRSTSSFQGKEQTKKILNQALLYELNGTIFRGVNSFFEKYFESYIPSTYHSAPSISALTGSKALQQLDVFLKPRGVDTSKYNWKDILVLREHKQSHPSPKTLLLQLSRYMYNLFISQLIRRFAYRFFLYGTKMELWIFDRSSSYSSSEFDIHKKLNKFILFLAGYAFISDKKLSLNTFTNCRSSKRTITLTSNMYSKKRKLQLDQKLFIKQRALPEADHLRLAYEKGIEGIAQFVGYQRITSIANLRSNLFTNQSGSLTQVLQLARQKSHNSRKRASVDSQNIATAKRQKSNSHSSGLCYELKPDTPSSLYNRSSNSYNNRQLGCLAISPAGQDVIRAHRSLYLTSKILYKDISKNNIIITDPRYANEFTGMLINLNLAKQISSGRSGACYQTGTMEFMAIEVLRNAEYTFRHNLEFFFYVLLWGLMHADGFDELLAQFPLSLAYVKLLCSELRRILFLISAESKLYIGTLPESESLYDATIKEFNNAISSIVSYPDS